MNRLRSIPTEFQRGQLVQAAWACIHGDRTMAEEFLRQLGNLTQHRNGLCLDEMEDDVLLNLAFAVYFAGTGLDTRLDGEPE